MKKAIFLIFILIVSSFFLYCVTENVTQNTVNGKNQINQTNLDIRSNYNQELLNESIIKATPIIVTDDFGYTVAITKIPKRIVSLAPSNTEILFGLGLGDRIVGVTDYCNYPPEALNKTKVGGYSTINIERVVTLKPDLVVAAYGNGKETVEVLRRLNITVVALNPKNIRDVEKDIELLGKITGTEKNASKLIDWMNKKIEWVKSKVEGPKVNVAHILWHDPIWVSGKNTFIDEVISIAGGKNVFDFEGWKVVSIEDLIEKNPDIIIVSSGSGMGGKKNVVYKWVISDERLKGINAVKNGRVYVINADIISRPSYRIAEAVEIVAKFLHPEAFD